ncbi:MAG TPA: hypothetical protein VGI45_03970 [Terracidiphilus sp.]
MKASVSDPHSVGFDIERKPSRDGSRYWLATYSDQGKTATFIIEIALPARMESEATGRIRISSGRGAFTAVPGSDASTMLVALKKALEAKHLPARVQRESRLPFEYVILGEHNSLAQDGGFSDKPAGNWTAMKIFFGDGADESEVFLNFNPVSQKAQFSEKDVDYGDAVLAKLATVL